MGRMSDDIADHSSREIRKSVFVCVTIGQPDEQHSASLTSDKCCEEAKLSVKVSSSYPRKY